jgi:hypothetical protein
VGLASNTGTEVAVEDGQCQARLVEDAFDVVNAVARLTELCCGPCRYWTQSSVLLVVAETGASEERRITHPSRNAPLPMTWSRETPANRCLRRPIKYAYQRFTCSSALRDHSSVCRIIIVRCLSQVSAVGRKTVTYGQRGLLNKE